MDATTALIMTVGGIVGAIITTQMWQMNWFKKENFKIKKLERELGLQNVSKPIPSHNEQTNILSSLAPILKNLDGDQLGALAEKFLGGDGNPETPSDSVIDSLMGFAQDNPEVVQGLLQGLSSGKTDESIKSDGKY